MILFDRAIELIMFLLIVFGAGRRFRIGTIYKKKIVYVRCGVGLVMHRSKNYFVGIY